MKFGNNMKIRAKFFIMVCVINLLVFILSIISMAFLKSSNSQYEDEIRSNSTLVSKGMTSISAIIDLRSVILSLDATSSALNQSRFNDARSELKQVYDKAVESLDEYKIYLEQISNTGGKDRKKSLEEVERLRVLIDNYYIEYLNHISMHQSNTFSGEGGRARHVNHSKITREMADEIFGAIGGGETGFVYELPMSAFAAMLEELNIVSEQTTFKILLILIIAVMVILFTCGFGVLTSMSIRRPVEKVIWAANKVVNGNLDIDIRTDSKSEMGNLSNSINSMAVTINNILEDINILSNELEMGNLSYRINTEKYLGTFKEAVNSINNAISNLIEDTLYVVNTVEQIGEGNFNTEIIDLPGDKKFAIESLRAVQNALKDVSDEINGLIKAAGDGNLEFRIDTEKYKGQWKETTKGLNIFVENVVIPIKETKNALEQFAIGNFEHRITNDYKGEFNSIKETVNYTAETIGSYINEISDTLTKMSNKDFTVSITREYLGDFAQIQSSVNDIVKNLDALTKGIICSAEKVSIGAKRISESSLSLARGATKQAETVEKLNFNIKHISSQTKENAQGSNKANILALETKENANEGSEQMDKMLLAMGEINRASGSISNIIKVIDDIAFQTNILALNAAVEAARAGEHGKGFAVVAEEVRSLAGRSQQAAKETTELIQSSVEKVEEGSKIANSTAEALHKIVLKIEEISSLVNSSAISSNRQENSINEMMNSINQISGVTQTNSATSQESAAASEELANEAEVFYSSVVDFKLKDIDEK